ncbi:hypothetical protein Glove_85g83 [Diversispora epigaea]|uniref:BTB domain-containing protein n=1 Tax=Diversispora epigaea TaxID=1348612 RepID=A0A397J6W8_9GLOM|nr:hypothetical protein Glove_85g83 [Diversispora epigaea]
MMMRTEFYTGLSQSFFQLLEDTYDYDVTIKVGENQNTQEFHAHSIILSARSPCFKSALSNRQTNDKKDGMILFTKPNVSPPVFTLIIKYIYSGVLDLTNVSGFNIFGLLVASDELILEELFKHVQNYLIEKEAAWLDKNLVKVLPIVSKLVNCKQLQDYCYESICADPEPFFTSKDFPILDKDIFLELIKRDDLEIEEIVLWDHLIKWGISQTPIIKQNDVKKFTDANFRDLKKTLDPFILHIRFHEISAKDFFNKVRPYKKVLPSALYDDVMSFLMAETEPQHRRLPARSSYHYIDLPKSKIIRRKHATILSNQILYKDASSKISKGNKYKFQLLYRGSRDGYDINTFYSKVNGKGQAIAVIKIRNSEKIIGGFNASGWNHKNYKNYNNNNNNHRCKNKSKLIGYSNIKPTYSDTDNNRNHFIFSFGENYKLKMGKFVSGIGMSYDNNFINFGNGDLIFDGRNGSCNQSSYDQSILDVDSSFVAEEMEVFKVIDLSEQSEFTDDDDDDL